MSLVSYIREKTLQELVRACKSLYEFVRICKSLWDVGGLDGMGWRGMADVGNDIICSGFAISPNIVLPTLHQHLFQKGFEPDGFSNIFRDGTTNEEDEEGKYCC